MVKCTGLIGIAVLMSVGVANASVVALPAAVSVPEPATALLLGTGLVALGVRLRKK